MSMINSIDTIGTVLGGKTLSVWTSTCYRGGIATDALYWGRFRQTLLSGPVGLVASLRGEAGRCLPVEDVCSHPIHHCVQCNEFNPGGYSTSKVPSYRGVLGWSMVFFPAHMFQ